MARYSTNSGSNRAACEHVLSSSCVPKTTDTNPTTSEAVCSLLREYHFFRSPSDVQVANASAHAMRRQYVTAALVLWRQIREDGKTTLSYCLLSYSRRPKDACPFCIPCTFSCLGMLKCVGVVWSVCTTLYTILCICSICRWCRALKSPQNYGNPPPASNDDDDDDPKRWREL